MLRRRPRLLTEVAGAVACLALLTASGCGAGAVTVGGPVRGPAVCTELLSALPDTVDGRQRRDVEPPDALAAAWGDPSIVLRCGVPEPSALTAASPCAEVNGVGWFAEERADGYRFTTIGRSTHVAVQVPYEYEPAADALVDIASAVRRTVPERDPCV